MITVTEMKDVAPVCPHCSEEITELWFRELPTVFGRRYIYFCSQCRKVLGITHRKGNLVG